MKYQHIISGAALLALAHSLQLPALRAQSSSASVTLWAVDGRGRRVDYTIEKFRDVDRPTVELPVRLKDATIDGLTLGASYSCTIVPKDPGMGLTKRITTIAVKNTKTVAVVSVASLPLVDYVTPLVARFNVKPLPSGEQEMMWVMVQPTFSTVFDELLRVETTKVDPHGHFELQGVRIAGSYLFIFYRGTNVIATKIVGVPFVTAPGQEIEIRLD